MNGGDVSLLLLIAATNPSTCPQQRFVPDISKTTALKHMDRQLPEMVVVDDNIIAEGESSSTPAHSSTIPCPGVTDEKLQSYAKLPPRTSDFSEKGHHAPYYLHAIYSQTNGFTTCSTTIRAHACDNISLPDGPCRACQNVKRLVLRKYLRSQMSEKRELKQYCPLSRVSKARLANALKLTRLERSKAMRQLQEIRSQLQKESVEVSDKSHCKLKAIIDSCQLQDDSFVKKFWEEQKKAFQRKTGGMRWHPMMVRFAVLLHSQSPAAYRSLRELGVLRLPAESTLRDYTNVLHPQSGFQMEVFLELKEMAATLHDNQRWVCLLHDELCIKSGLVYDYRSGELVGFVDENQRDQKSARDQHLATHALVFMVVGITSNIKLSLGYFPTRTATADHIFPHLWTAVGLLETLCNLKVIACTSDKASPNQRLIRIHGSTYKARNMFAPDRFLYFFSDAPHLVKTVRNNLQSSGAGKNTRYLWNNGSELLWTHIARLYHEDARRELRRTKLTAEHIYITPQSVMRVYLAAQVLSNSVGQVMREFGDKGSQETANFILLMDKFFDCLNTRSVTEGARKANKYLLPFRALDDDRFQFLEKEFLGYLEAWRASVQTRDGFSKVEKNKMFLTHQTYEGLQTTVYSVIEATKFLLQSGVEMVLTNKFCQDPLEEHFGRHRCLCVRSDNPTLWTFGYQENRLRMQRNIATAIVPRGNVRGKREANVVVVDDTPLPKIRRC